ncbi:elongation factor P [Erythrobacter sp. GH1-10]|uniref:elongation factor P n=1 Tax=Erythrobacter sp. GH1-10 TaxID=3349334 RepID=UPI00387813BB
MKTRYVVLLTAVAAIVAATSPLIAQKSPPSGGMLRTMPLGTYECALPGDAGGEAYRVVEEEQFRIRPASGYDNAEGKGIYILRGTELTFTRGPKKGEVFERIGTNQLKRGEMICTRLGGSA